MKTFLISVNPCFYSTLGHNYYYLQAVEKACTNIGWGFSALLPRKNNVSNLPPNWRKVIHCPTTKVCYPEIEKQPYKRPKKIVRARQRVSYYFSLAQQLLREFQSHKNRKFILFYEAFSLTDLKLIYHLLQFLPHSKVELWLMLRYPVSFFKEEARGYKSIFAKMKVKFKLVTDTELLKEDLEAYFEYPVSVFPIPISQEVHNISENKAKSEHLKCWWPGVVREGKGLKIIQGFAASQNKESSLIELIAAKKAKLTALKKGPKIQELDDVVTKKEYDRHLKESHVILLPYTDHCYQKTSSNIFAEAILSGSIPLVYPNTWMAYELEKNQLTELILDWNLDSLSQKIVHLSRCKETEKKLKKIKKEYQIFHNIDSYGKVMSKLAELS